MDPQYFPIVPNDRVPELPLKPSMSEEFYFDALLVLGIFTMFAQFLRIMGEIEDD